MDDLADNVANDPVEALLAECLDAHPLEWPVRVDAAAKQAPEFASELMRRFRLLVGDLHVDPSASTPAAAAPPGPPPATIGEFTILDKLGSGGMGIVYRALQGSLQREVALKTIHTGRSLDAAARERLKIEAEAAARLDHIGVLPVHSFGVANGEPWIAMPLFDGVTLQTVLRRVAGRDPQSLTGRDLLEAVQGSKESVDPLHEIFQRDWVSAVLAIGAQVARALHHAHDRGVLHRDVKPSNIMLGRKGRAVLIDFGLARIIHRERDRLTREGTAPGTLIYMAPERVLGKSDATIASDVYGLGATLYELLTLQTPFEGDSSAAMKAATLSAAQPPVRPRNRRVSAEAEVVIQAARASHASDRYPDARFLAQDLENLLARRPIIARRSPAHRRMLRWAQRHPAITTGAIAGLVLLIGAPLALNVATARSRDAAVERAAEANHILGYTLDLLSTPPRFDQGGESTTLIDVIDAGILGLDGDFQGTAASRERLRANFAHALRQRGQHERALELYDTALTADLSDDPLDQELRAWALFGSAFSLRSLGRPEEAIERIRDSLEVAEASFAAGSEELADYLTGAAKIHLGSRHVQTGVGVAQRALEHIREHRPDDRLRAARAQAVLAQAYAESGQPVEASSELETAVEMLRQAAPPGDIDLAQAILRLGSLAQRKGDMHRAMALYREGRDAAARFQGENGDLTLSADSSIGAMLLQEGAVDEAVNLLESTVVRMLEHHREAPIIAHAALQLMVGLERQQRIPDLVRLSEEQGWLGIMEAEWGRKNGNYGTSCQKVAFQALALGRFAVAIRALERFVAHCALHDGLRPIEIQARMALASVFEHELKDRERAAKEYRAALHALDGETVQLTLAPDTPPMNARPALDAAIARVTGETEGSVIPERD